MKKFPQNIDEFKNEVKRLEPILFEKMDEWGSQNALAGQIIYFNKAGYKEDKAKVFRKKHFDPDCKSFLKRLIKETK